MTPVAEVIDSSLDDECSSEPSWSSDGSDEEESSSESSFSSGSSSGGESSSDDDIWMSRLEKIRRLEYKNSSSGGVSSGVRDRVPIQ